MSTHLNIIKSPEGLTISIDNKEWSKEKLPIDGFTFGKSSCHESIEKAFEELSELQYDRRVTHFKENENKITFSFEPSTQLEKAILRTFREAIPLLASQEELITSMTSEEFKVLQHLTAEELDKKVAELEKEKAHRKLKHLYGENGYELLRRLPETELSKLLEQLKTISTLTEQEIQDLKNRDWSRIKTFDELRVLKTHLEGKIDLRNFVTYELFRGCYNANGQTLDGLCHQVVKDNGEIDLDALALLRSGLDNSKSFTPEEIEEYIEVIKTLDPKETYFFTHHPDYFTQSKELVVERAKDAEKSLNRAILPTLDTIFIDEFFYHLIEFRLNFNMRDDNISLNVLPPPLQEAMYQFKFKENAMAPNYVIGISKGADFEHAHQRDILIPSTLNAYTHADGYRVTDVGFYHHDFVFHFFTEGANPHRAAYIDLAKEFKSQKRIKLWMLLIDRDFGFYASRETIGNEQLSKILDKLNHGELFWYAFAFINSQLVQGRRPYFGEKNLQVFPEESLRHIYKNQEKWKARFNISIEDLANLKKALERIIAESPQEVIESFEIKQNLTEISNLLDLLATIEVSLSPTITATPTVTVRKPAMPLRSLEKERISILNGVSEEETAQLLDSLATVHSLTEAEIESLKSGVWEQVTTLRSIITEKRVLKSYLEGKIDLQLFVSFQLILNCCPLEIPLKGSCFQLINQDGSLNTEAQLILEKGLQSTFYPEEIAQFFDEVKQLPSEHSLFVIYHSKAAQETSEEFMKRMDAPLSEEIGEDEWSEYAPDDIPINELPKQTRDQEWAVFKTNHQHIDITEVLNLLIAFGLNLSYNSEGFLDVVLLNPSLSDILFRVKFGEQVPSVNYVLGSPPFKENTNELTITIPSHLVTVKSGHGFGVNSATLYYYDSTYRMFNKSANPNADAYEELLEALDRDPMFKIIGVNSPFYTVIHTESLPDPTVPEQFETIDFLKKIAQRMTKGEQFWFPLLVLAVPGVETQNLPERLIAYIQIHESDWKAKYQISFDDLRSLANKIKEFRSNPPDTFSISPAIEQTLTEFGQAIDTFEAILGKTGDEEDVEDREDIEDEE